MAEVKKFLSYDGLGKVWTKVKENFIQRTSYLLSGNSSVDIVFPGMHHSVIIARYTLNQPVLVLIGGGYGSTYVRNNFTEVDTGGGYIHWRYHSGNGVQIINTLDADLRISVSMFHGNIPVFSEAAYDITSGYEDKPLALQEEFENYLNLSGTNTMTGPISWGNYRKWAVPQGPGLSVMSAYGQAPVDGGAVAGGNNFAVGLNIGGNGYHMGLGWNVDKKKLYVRGSAAADWQEVSLGTPHEQYIPKSNYLNSPSGWLITSDLDGGAANMCYVEIFGNSYSGGNKLPFKTLLNFYDYTPTGGIIGSPSAVNLGNNSIQEIKIFRYNGKVCLWFQRLGSFQTFYVLWYTQKTGYSVINHVQSITDSAMPDESSITFLVNVVPEENLLGSELGTTEINNICV